MKVSEYNVVKELTYLEYCNCLQMKYGIGLEDFMTKNFVSNPKCKRTNEGLFAHHKAEDRMILLSNPKVAEICPFEWQKKENIVYCDYLEHLLLHAMICKYPSSRKVQGVNVGIGGIIDYLVPELNCIYSGYEPKEKWKRNCYAKVVDDKESYMEILRDFIAFEESENPAFDRKILCSCLYGQDENGILEIYKEIESL